jgi:murein DD-endopeptidase MepM/ murein hydrolase activator NlpD
MGVTRLLAALAIALLPGVGLAGWEVQSVALGKAPVAPADTLSPRLEAALLAEVAATSKRLGLVDGPAKDPRQLRWPMLADAGLPGSDRSFISNYVDRDSGFPNRLRDYACGTRTYDTSSGYNHRGIDIATWPFAWQGMAQESVNVVAAAGGTLVLRRDGNFDRNCSLDAPDTPNMVIVRHDDGSIAMYLHLKNGSLTPKQVGDRVDAGEFLGKVGSSGISTAPHLHLELRDGQQPNAAVIDPFSGQCNSAPSRWAAQPAYDHQELELVAVHDAPPEFFFEACSRTEAPHHARHLRPGQRFYVAGYYGGQKAGEPSTVVLRGPGGVELSRFEHRPTAAQMEAEYLRASYWTFSFTVPANAAPGLYRAEIGFRGETRSASFVVGGAAFAASGAWFDPGQSGHGLLTEVVEQEGEAKLTATWFTYLDGQPRWLFGIADLSGNEVRVPMSISRGGRFPPAFRSADVQFEPWGELRLRFAENGSAQLGWDSTLAGFGRGELSLARLATPADINRDDVGKGMRACTSGSWFDPAQSGHGVQLQVIETAGTRSLLVAWYVYRDGEQTWLTGVGPIDGNRATVALDLTRGGQFPPAFRSGQVQREPWGEATFTLIDPTRLDLRWQSSVAGFGSGELALQRLTGLLTAPCL